MDKDNVVVFKEDELDEGTKDDNALYEELMGYANKDFTDDAVYEEFCKIMDIDSFADYYATEIYIGVPAPSMKEIHMLTGNGAI